ncbi:glyoxylase-like metal-dependent hydrolase (beta-lactamase superfamily II) [Brevundimonas alba]|uniref:Glyoxylase-like metal-dependent hydrolase (Beta-lactamase superfamily II) n=1 Tax=Brevundimonas alba TaxID=74314 RepID=A0A7X6BPG2_9CAUL|nr:MBL fold metallo-hydrolase [Brevundimonas alba]NJC41481.1 glyoxylase-like metal-dependent hydrolase (beta-lactamase superfamily II) [Brevundimonas alba]
MTFYARIAAASLILAAMGAAACSPEPEKREATSTPPAALSHPDIHAFRIGQIQAVALKDGEMAFPATNREMSPWSDTAEVSALLTASGQADGQIHLSIQPLLVRDGERVVLIDTGAGGQMGTEGKLLASLRAAGVEPGQVTDVLISHAHGDHVGGLAGKDGALTFPNAVVRMSAAEWEFAKAGAAEAGAAPLLAAITPRVQTFAPGAQVTPSIKAVPLAGHTPGHSGYEIVSGTERLLYIGDAMHSSLVSVQRPELVNGWDSDGAPGVTTRQGLLNRGASESLRVYGVHFPFPGVGRFQRRDDGFVWVPES